MKHAQIFSPPDYGHLLKLADAFCLHVDRKDITVADWIGVPNRLFARLRGGHGCNVDTYILAFRWFGENWPADLEWPKDVPVYQGRAAS